MRNIHMLSIGGSAMHNIALALQKNGYQISGSDDEIYNPSRQRLADAGLLPEKMGWFPEKITKNIDAIILGMHARENNPEIARAKVLGIPMYSYPEFIYEHARDKKRVVIVGSHGKTTTTSMIMHVLKEEKLDFDYLVGGQIEGFEHMVRLSDASLMVIEGDEYLSSVIDRRPKMLLYKPHISVVTGIAWDHMNVFPTFENYKQQFDLFIDTVEPEGKVFCFAPDPEVAALMKRNKDANIELIPYTRVSAVKMENLNIFGPHNRANLKAALLVCKELGIGEDRFFKHISTFTGTQKRLQQLIDRPALKVYFDFAHAPSKLRATVEAVKSKYPDKRVIALYELHTYSSLNKDFILYYKNTMNLADDAAVYFNAHTLKMKQMPDLSKDYIYDAFMKKGMKVFDKTAELVSFIQDLPKKNAVYLFMSSGNFEKLDITALFE